MTRAVVTSPQQAITFFDAGFRDEAIRHVNNMVVGSPDFKQPCDLVQVSNCSIVFGFVFNICI